MVGYLLLPDGKKVDVADGLILGRTSSCAVVLKDTKASRRHAQLIVAGPIVEIEDLQSSNGTLLNDKPVKRRMLRDGDVVQIGTTQITYRERDLARSSEPSEVPDQPGPGEDLFADDGDADEVELAPVAPVADVEVLEFADEDVVAVPKAPPAPKPDRPRSAAASHVPNISMTKTVMIPKRDRRPFGSGMGFGDDLRQMSLPMRLLGMLLAVAVAGGLGYLAFKLAS